MNRAWFLVAAAGCAAAACIPNAIPATAADIAAAKSKCPADGMIDDCEDNNNQVMSNKGRSGYWYTFADKTTKIEPAGGGTFTIRQGRIDNLPMFGRIVAGLNRSRLVTITADPHDARRLRIRATAKGTRLLQKGRQLRIVDLASHLDQLAPEDLAKLAKAVEILQKLLERWL